MSYLVFVRNYNSKHREQKKTLIERLSPLKDEALFEKRISFIDKKFQFKTSLPRANVPPATACWKFDATLFPKIGQVDIDNYQAHKRQGRKGQYRKAYRMFQSRIMKHIKVLKRDRHIIYVKASVLKSFSSSPYHIKYSRLFSNIIV